ncbi:alpha/beta fold hydrolase [Streptomyces boncukensis]|uniref:Alpha/beta hydrolase n=1 Tax=Streptomyces boncukensis TaxID=2711219 RepID=A0A6G4WZK2_9ACTN|nr:alpha/beta hydrolase [Streptomyces boncukensis]NGO70037.1 alpha/beta hydrolase [Streptomyces boncukensis]
MSRPPFLDLPAGARAYRLSTARGEFAVQECGAPERGTALLLPGFTGSKEDFIGLLAPLADAGFRAVAVDPRGQYETGGPDSEQAYAQSELALDALALAGALTTAGEPGAAATVPGSPPHLLGHSLGGLVARAAALRAPERFASLTLMSCGPAAVSASQQQRVTLLLSALGSMSMEAVWQAMRELDQSPAEAGQAPYPDGAGPDGPGARVPPDIDAFLRRRWLANVPAQLVAGGRQLIGEPDRTDELAALPLPVHVVSGSVDDAWPVPQLDAMALRLGARRSAVPGTGHSPNAERPRTTAEALTAFWRELSPCPG